MRYSNLTIGRYVAKNKIISYNVFVYYANTVSNSYNSLDPNFTGSIRFEVNYSRVVEG